MDFYRRADHAFSGLPGDIPALAQIIGGVLVHRDHAAAFGFELPPERRDEANTLDLAAILAHLGSLAPRPPRERFAGTCRDFAVMLVAMLRSQGRPARARAGFAGYFAEGWYDDHWVAEVWEDDAWRLFDAQLLSAEPGTYTKLDVDPANVPRDAFLVGGQAWLECRTGHRDPSTLGVHSAGLSGMWEIQGNVIRDLAALNRDETLPWDNWGLIPIHYDTLPPEDVALLDDLAAVSAAGGPLEKVQEAYPQRPAHPVARRRLTAAPRHALPSHIASQPDQHESHRVAAGPARAASRGRRTSTSRIASPPDQHRDALGQRHTESCRLLTTAVPHAADPWSAQAQKAALFALACATGDLPRFTWTDRLPAAGESLQFRTHGEPPDSLRPGHERPVPSTLDPHQR